MFQKDSVMESAIFFEMKEGCKVSCFILLADLLGSQYLFEILQASLTVKNSENVVKSGCFEKRLRWRPSSVFRNERRM